MNGPYDYSRMILESDISGIWIEKRFSAWQMFFTVFLEWQPCLSSAEGFSETIPWNCKLGCKIAYFRKSLLNPPGALPFERHDTISSLERSVVPSLI